MKRDEPAEPLSPGLYLVATPIGNLEDITLRALRVLRDADLIACEDTRHTRKLLNHFAIATPTLSYHEHNEAGRAAELVEKLKQNARIALVSDAGMPAISDPGFRVIGLAVESGIRVIPVPGASAFVSALAASGLPADSFCFHGFLPAKAGARRSVLESVKASSRADIFYEAPHRLLESLHDIQDVLGPERELVIARELTKVHEEFLRGSAGELSQALKARDIKGEITLIIGKASAAAKQAGQMNLEARVDELMREQQLDEKAALKKLARETGLSKSELYRRLQSSRSR
jgi:16S rRNA (cytidine1402-2'-O)-methyltransferase